MARGINHSLQQLSPIRFRPVFGFASATGMKSKQAAGVSRRFVGYDRQSGHGVRIEDRDSFKGLQIHLGCVKKDSLVRSMWSGDELRRGTARQVGPENTVRIIQVGND